MRNYFNKLSVDIYGESHSEQIGVVIGGLPVGFKIDLERLQKHVDRRKASACVYSTKRIEDDIVVIKNGIDENGVIIGDKCELAVYNRNYRKSDYNELAGKPRPSHADYPAYVKYGTNVSLSGGGKYSGRLTVAICIAGGIAEQLLEKAGVKVFSYVSKIGNVDALSYKERMPTEQELIECKSDSLRFFDNRNELDRLLTETALSKDSIGGIVETIVSGLPIGLGDSLFDGIESAISSAVFAVPAVKGIEFGLGFDFATASASNVNDCYYYDEHGNVKTYTNNNGGIVGGMTNGEPITFRTVVKPTPSIARKQRTVDLINKTDTEIEIKGRHDVCITPRAVAPIESATALALYDMLVASGTLTNE